MNGSPTSLKLFVLLLALGVSGSAFADKAAMKKADATLAERAKAASETCKTAISAEIDWQSFKGKFNKEKWFGPEEVGVKCHDTLDVVRSFCKRNERNQRGIAESLSAITCVYESGSEVGWQLKKKKAEVGYGNYEHEVDDIRTKHFPLAFLGNGGPAELEYWSDKLQKEVVAPANEACGKKLKVNIEWPGFVKNFNIAEGKWENAESVYNTCRGMVGDIQAWCGSKNTVEKRAKRIKAGLSGMTCKWDKNATRKKLKRAGASYKFKKKHLTSGWSWATQSPATELHDFFLVHFKIDQSHAKGARKTMDKQRIRAYKSCKRKCKSDSCRRRCSGKHGVRE